MGTSRPRLRLQDAAYAPLDARAKATMQLSKPAVLPSVLQPSMPPGVFVAPRPNAKSGTSKRARKSKIDTKADQATPAPSPNEESSEESTLLTRLCEECDEVSLHEILPCIGAVARDAHGSTFLKALMSEAPNEVKAMLFGAALHEMVSTCMHNVGHTFILQLLEMSTSEQKKVLAGK